jgi:hypothetical protein
VLGTSDGRTVSNGKSYGDTSYDKLKKLRNIWRVTDSLVILKKRIAWNPRFLSDVVSHAPQPKSADVKRRDLF